MKNLIYTIVTVASICTLFACNQSSVDAAEYEKRLTEAWRAREIIVKDSMDRACQQKIDNDLAAAVDSVLIKRGLKK